MVEEKMTTEEREVFQSIRSSIGQEVMLPSIKEQLLRDLIFFYGWNEDEGASRSAVSKWAIANEDFNALWFDDEYAKKWGER